MKNKEIFPVKYNALKIIKTKKGKIINKITKDNFLYKDDIKKKFVLIKVLYSNINFKDFLMSKNNGGLIKKFPHTLGIDASGVVYYSNSKKFKKNDKVFVIAQPLGVEINGSFSQFILVPDHWVNKLPKNLSSKEIMMMGTSGFTAIKALNKTLKTILKHKNKPVLVTGVTGNVGMFLIILLKNLGITIEAISSKKENNKILKNMGIKKVHSLKNFVDVPDFALLNEKYSVIFDNLGGELISVGLKCLIKGGVLVSIGNILNNKSTINILPLILRGVSVIGVNAEFSSLYERKNIFQKFKSIKLKKMLLKKTRTISLNDVLKVMKSKNYRKKKVRFIVKI
jgi:acrylyl-CoA reductase (NADPH)